jgi:zinc transporter 1
VSTPSFFSSNPFSSNLPTNMGHSHFQVSRKTRLRAVIAISFTFFLAEISVGFYTKSLALVADAFHYLNDLIGFIVALVAVHMTERKTSPTDLSFGWARAQLLGAFFNGAFLLALGLSILLQSIERFIDLKHVENPKLVLIVGCVGLTLNSKSLQSTNCIGITPEHPMML